MTDSREPSYYEIALTNRQVMTVFVILLLCVVAAFFAGVWVGKREAVLPVDMLASQADEPVAEAEAEPLGEFNFFSQEEPSPEPETAETAGEPAPPEPAPGPAQGPQAGEPAVRAQPPPPTGAPPRAQPPAATGVLVIQVFSSSDREQAMRVVDRLRAGGFAALLSPVEVGERTMYRVRIGPFRERAEAERVADRVRRDFKLDTWITAG